MTHPRQPQTPSAAPWPVDAYDAEHPPLGPRAPQLPDRRSWPAPADLAGASNRDGSVPTWAEARHALFGTGARSGLVARCPDDESLIAAALDRDPYLAAYCAHMGRDRLAFAPIHDDEHDRGRRELDRLRQEYEALAAPWEERCERGHALDVRSGDLRKPNYAGVVPDRRP
jgi:hypothetical protein